MAKNTIKNSKSYNIKARDTYEKTKIRKVSVRFNIETEYDLWEHISKCENKAGYIKDLISKDIKSE